MSDFEAMMHKNMIRFLVQRTIFCPLTGNVLDMDTCAVILDADGDPKAVYDPSIKTKCEQQGILPTMGDYWMDR